MNGNVPLNQDDSPRMQSSLGSIYPYREYDVMKSGTLALGHVVSVDYSKMTAVVSLLDNNYAESTANTFSGALIPVTMFNYNPKGEAYGEYRPIATGTRVLLGYIDSDLNKPIILGVYPDDVDNVSQIATTTDDKATDLEYPYRDQVLTEKTVYPSQHVKLSTERGDYFHSYDGNSLTKVTSDPKVKDVSYSGKVDPNLINQSTGKTYDVKSRAQNMLLLHQANMDDDKHKTRLFLDSSGAGQAYWSDALDKDKLLKVDADKDNGFRATYQHDSSTSGEASVYTKFELTPKNTLKITSQNGGTQGTLEVTPEGTEIDGVKVATEGALSGISNKLNAMQSKVDAVSNAMGEVGIEYIKGLKDTISGINLNIGTNSNTIQDMNTTLANVKRTAEDAWNKTQTNQEQEQNDYKNLDDKIDKLQSGSTIAGLDDLKSQMAELVKNVPDIEASIKDYEAKKNNFLTTDSDYIKNIETENESLKKEVETNKTEITDLKTKLDAVETTNATLKDSLDALKAQVDKLSKN